MQRSLILFSVVLTTNVVAQDEIVDDVFAHGERVYSETCIACHGDNGKGAIPGIQDLTAADGLLTKPDDELIESITEGFSMPRSPVAMPPMGGNPGLNRGDIVAVIAFLRVRFQIPPKAGELSN